MQKKIAAAATGGILSSPGKQKWKFRVKGQKEKDATGKKDVSAIVHSLLQFGSGPSRG
jgi:hypothetical protein